MKLQQDWLLRDAFGAFQSAVCDNDFTKLRAVSGGQMESRLKRYLAIDTLPSASDIARVAAPLNATGTDEDV
ncbi:hypothetical protein ACHAXN_005581 [Cyclotella atomus]